jgi:putative NIF3 family GTP cyclohydrolase 1 type 2
MTANQIVATIQAQIGPGWKPKTADTFLAGRPDTEVTGIVTTFTPTLDVLRHAVTSGKNMIVSREFPYWIRNPDREPVASSPTYLFKRDFIEKNNLVIWRFNENWQARTPDPQLVALQAALGWQNNPHKFPATTLQALARSVRERLKIRALRVIGDPQLRVSSAALTHGLILVPEMRKALAEIPADVMVIGEPVEWEAAPYFQDIIASGQKKGLLVLGNEASEEPGCSAMAFWLKSFIKEIPIEWLPAGEPFV